MTNKGTSCTVSIKVLPKSSRDEIVGFYGDVLKVAVTAPPEKGKANKALVKLLSAKLKIKKRDIEITSGKTSQVKRLKIGGLDVRDFFEKLKI